MFLEYTENFLLPIHKFDIYFSAHALPISSRGNFY